MRSQAPFYQVQKKGIIFIRVAYSDPFLTGLWGNLAILVASGAIDSGSNPDSPTITILDR